MSHPEGSIVLLRDKNCADKKRVSWMKDNWEELCGGHRDVERYPNGSKSGPIFGNLYTMARWMCTQDSPLVRKGIPPVLLNPSSRQREIGERTNIQTFGGEVQEERRIVSGRRRRTGREGEDRASLFLREEEGFERAWSIVFCSVKCQMRLLHERDWGEKEKSKGRWVHKRRD